MGIRHVPIGSLKLSYINYTTQRKGNDRYFAIRLLAQRWTTETKQDDCHAASTSTERIGVFTAKTRSRYRVESSPQQKSSKQPRVAQTFNATAARQYFGIDIKLSIANYRR